MGKQFTLVISLVLGIIGYFKFRPLILISLALVYLHLAFPQASLRLGLALERMSTSVFRALSYVVLTLVFVLVLTPLAFAYRAFHRNPLKLNKERVSSTWEVRKDELTPEDFERPY